MKLDGRLARAASIVTFGLIAVLVTAAPAAATSTFDPATGTGYVDKADVQQAFGWKDQVFQANVRKVTFHAEQVVSWSWDCQGSTLTADAPTSWSVGSFPIGSTHGRWVAAVSGFTLTGPGVVASSDPVASCASGDPSNVSSATTVILYADFRDESQAVLTT